jgi:ASC-1-like (ASCH) protein
LGSPVSINLFVNEPWLSNIRDGKKRVEGRAGALEDFSCWVGRQATFYNSKQKVTVRILDVHHYGPLKEFLAFEGWANAAPHLRNMDESVAAYLQFYPGTYIDKAGGMNGIVISVVKKLRPQ